MELFYEKNEPIIGQVMKKGEWLIKPRGGPLATLHKHLQHANMKDIYLDFGNSLNPSHPYHLGFIGKMLSREPARYIFDASNNKLERLVGSEGKAPEKFFNPQEDTPFIPYQPAWLRSADRSLVKKIINNIGNNTSPNYAMFYLGGEPIINHFNERSFFSKQYDELTIVSLHPQLEQVAHTVYQLDSSMKSDEQWASTEEQYRISRWRPIDEQYRKSTWEQKIEFIPRGIFGKLSFDNILNINPKKVTLEIRERPTDSDVRDAV